MGADISQGTNTKRTSLKELHKVQAAQDNFYIKLHLAEAIAKIFCNTYPIFNSLHLNKYNFTIINAIICILFTYVMIF